MINPIDYMQLARQAVETLKPIVGELGLHVTGHALWDWLKSKLHGSGAAALDAVAIAPEDSDEWEALELRIRQTITKNPALADELAALLPGTTSTSQSNVTIGDHNTNVQASGTGIQIEANRGDAPKST